MENLLITARDRSLFKSLRYPYQRRIFLEALGFETQRSNLEALHSVVQRVADKGGISVALLYAKGRKQRLVTPLRREVWYHAYHILGHSTAQIGREFDRHHSTILFGIVRWAMENNLPCMCSMKKAVDYRSAGG
jgi:hypothetical protein